jgi:iron complex transport system substrate-binding protein
MIEAAGGTNIFNDVDSSWTQVNWEDVVDRNPEHIVIIDYGETNAQGKIDFLKGQPELADVDAIQNDNFVVLTYAEATPGPRNVARTRTLAEAFYPEKFADDEDAASTDEARATDYPVSIENGEHTLVFEQPPERAVSLNLHTTEIMLALGLADRMVGTAFGNAPILPRFAVQYDAIPVLAEEYPSTEVLASVEPDFTYGRSSAHREDGVGNVEDLEVLGITAYTVQGTLVEAATMEDVYTDMRNLGRIFDIQSEAEALIASMEQEIAAVQDQIGDVEEPVRVLVYDAGTDDLFTAGQSLQTHLIELAGGRNVFDDVEDNWVTVSWEEAVARSPDVIVINDYGDTPADEKIDFLLNNPALSSLPAIQNERIIVLPLPSVFEGVRNPDAVRLLASGFYPDRFE